MGTHQEDVEGRGGATWPTGDYDSAAFDLGTTQGSYVAGGDPLPSYDWLSRDWLRGWVDALSRHVPLLDDDAAWTGENAVFATLRERFADMWAARETLLAIVESAPSCVVHCDFWPTNLIATDDGTTVAVDWSQVGIGAVGHDLDQLTLDPVWMQVLPDGDLDALESELGQYEGTFGELLAKPRLVALNKIDVPEARELADLVRPDLEARGMRVFEISAVAHTGLRELTYALAEVVEADRAARPAADATRIVLSPTPVNGPEFTVTPVGDGFVVRGVKPERWVRQTDFQNDEAVGYLADRLNRLGVEEELFKAGAVPGSTVLIGPADNSVVFDWEPTMATGAELLGPRGTDLRLDESTRATRSEKRDEFHRRKDAQREAREELDRERKAGLWTDRDPVEIDSDE